jgi:hypothetical protein
MKKVTLDPNQTSVVDVPKLILGFWPRNHLTISAVWEEILS